LQCVSTEKNKINSVKIHFSFIPNSFKEKQEQNKKDI
jgi:hypothetical protein